MGMLPTCCASVTPAAATIFVDGNRDGLKNLNVYIYVCVCVCVCVCRWGFFFRLLQDRTESWTPNRAVGCSEEKVDAAEQMTLFIQNLICGLIFNCEIRFGVRHLACQAHDQI